MGEQLDSAKLAQLRAKLVAASKGPFVPDLDRVGWTYQAWERNAHLLLHHIQAPHPDISIAIETRVPGTNPEIYRQFQAELFRLLLNFAASASALLDHMRILEQMMEVSNPSEHLELLRRRKEFSDSGVAHFVKNLRNFILHRDLPTTAGQTSFTSGDVAIRFDTLLPTDSLLRWKGWDKESKAFLEQYESVSVSKAIIEYGTLAATFYSWVFRAIHAVCFRNAERKVNLDLAIAALERNIEKQTDQQS